MPGQNIGFTETPISSNNEAEFKFMAYEPVFYPSLLWYSNDLTYKRVRTGNTLSLDSAWQAEVNITATRLIQTQTRLTLLIRSDLS